MMGRASLVLTAAVLALSLLACRNRAEPRPARPQEYPLFGMVYDADSQPCVGARITVDGRPGPTTDINGRFGLASLPLGRHRLEVAKEDFEPVSTVFDFVDRKQVLYLKVVSHDQLLRLAEQALQEGKLQDAGDLLRRAEAIRPDDPVGLYLRAIGLVEAGRFGDAVGALEGLLSRGYREAAVYLTLADLYQYRLGDPRRAAMYLEEALRREKDPDVRRRLDDLRGQSAPGTPEAGPGTPPP